MFINLHVYICVYIHTPGVYLKACRQRKSPPVTVILLIVLECVHMHIYCVKVNMADCFQDCSTCC